MCNIKENSIVMMVHDNRIDRRVLDEARSLQNDGWEVTVIGGPPPFPGYHNDEDNYPDINIIRIDTRVKVKGCDPKFPVQRSILSKINWGEIFLFHNLFLEKALDSPAKYYVAHDLPQLPAAAILASHFKGYLIYDSHELYPEQYLLSKNQKRLYSEAEEFLIHYVDQVITVNNSLSKFFSLKYNIQEPEVILNCPSVNADTLPFKKTKILHNELHIDTKKKILLYQGSVNKYKNDIRNLEKLLLSMKYVEDPDVVLVFLGPGGNSLPEFLELANQEGVLNSKFYYHEAVSQDILLKYTASADAGIIPYPHIDFNTYFCSPNKLFEFIVAGLPILANNSPELNEFVTHQKIGINREMKTVNDFADAINDFFSSSYMEFKKNIDKLSSKYIWEREGEKIVKIFKRISEQPPQCLASSILDQINKNIENAKLKFARLLCEAELEKNPRNVTILNSLALIELNKQNYKKAIKIIEIALNLDSYNETLLNNLNYISEFLYRKNTYHKDVKTNLEHFIKYND